MYIIQNKLLLLNIRTYSYADFMKRNFFIYEQDNEKEIKYDTYLFGHKIYIVVLMNKTLLLVL